MEVLRNPDLAQWHNTMRTSQMIKALKRAAKVDTSNACQVRKRLLDEGFSEGSIDRNLEAVIAAFSDEASHAS